MPLGHSSVTLLFNHPTRGIMSIVNRLPISLNNDDEHYKLLVERQTKNDRNHDNSRNYTFIPVGSTAPVQWEDGDRWTHDTIIGKGDHNHSNRSYTKCIKSQDD